MIEAEGADVAKRVFAGWAELLSAGPSELVFTGGLVLNADAEYETLQFDRNEVVGVLRKLTVWCGQVRSGKGRLYLYHGGV